MPVGFWNDPDGKRYKAAYFETYPNIWRHGDYVELTEHGGIVVYGRSDAVLNPGGVRIGTAEIYRQVEQLPEVVESIVIGQDWDNDVRVVLFVRLREGVTLDEALQDKIKKQIRANTTPRHVPAKIVAGLRHPAHQVRQDRRARRARRGARAAGEEQGSAGQSGGAGAVRGDRRNCSRDGHCRPRTPTSSRHPGLEPGSTICRRACGCHDGSRLKAGMTVEKRREQAT